MIDLFYIDENGNSHVYDRLDVSITKEGYILHIEDTLEINQQLIEQIISIFTPFATIKGVKFVLDHVAHNNKKWLFHISPR